MPLEVLVNENRAALVETPVGPVPLRRVQADIRGMVAELAVKGLGAGLAAPLDGADLDGCARRCGSGARWMANGRYRGTSRAGWATPPGRGWSARCRSGRSTRAR